MLHAQQLGHFTLLEEIGHGGMGTVCKALDLSLNRHVAIKLLSEEFASNPEFVASFLREARNAAAVSHPHIVQVHFVGEADGQVYVVMELLHGRTLADIIKKDGPLDEEQALQIATEVAEALRAAYQTNQMIHGDIKPSNIFVTSEHVAKVLDFGLAKLANSEHVQVGEIWGSPYYISPERVSGKAEDFRSDVYSLGATLFHALTGQPPFDAPTPEELSVKRLNEKAPPARELRPALTAETEQVVVKLLSKSALMRVRDYDQLLEWLREAKSAATAKRLGIHVHTGKRTPRTPSAPEPIPDTTRRTLWMTIALAGGMLVAIGLGVSLWSRHGSRLAPTQAVARTDTPGPVRPPPSEQERIDELRQQQDRITAEVRMLQSADAELTAFWTKFDFLAVVARYDTLARQLTTAEVKQLVVQRIDTARRLAEFKTQLIADITQQPYTRGDLVTRAHTPLAGQLVRANDVELTFTVQYGELIARWSDLSPGTVLYLARHYAFARTATETDDAKTYRQQLIAAFTKQYKSPTASPKPAAP